MNVIVTGGTGALGSAVVETFLSAGHSVIAVSRQSGSAKKGRDRLFWVSHDLTGTEAAQDLVQDAIERFGSFQAVVHTMGAFAGGELLEDTANATWHNMLETNLYSAFYLLRAVLPHLKKQKFGRVLAVGSKAAVQPAGGLSAYVVSKAGLYALIATLALELKDSGVTANLVLPSVIDTPANRQAMPGADFSKWVAPEAIAKLLLWLASEEAKDVNGAAIPIYGNA